MPVGHPVSTGHCCSRAYIVSNAAPWSEFAFEQTNRGTVRIARPDDPDEFAEAETIAEAVHELTGLPADRYILIQA